MCSDLARAVDSLDGVIADTAATTFARFTLDLDDGEKVGRVSTALDSLNGSIRRLEMPDYQDEWVALFYSLWYQPFQINAAYSLICRVIEERNEPLTRTGRLSIWDFGGGALAMEIGLALAALDAASYGKAIPEINVTLIEPSDAMTRTGLDIWERFMIANGFGPSVDMDSWSATAQLGPTTIQLQRVAAPFDMESQPEADRWLVAIHAYYGEQREAIKRDLSQIRQALQPGAGLFTCHADSLAGIDCVSPFAGSGTAISISPLKMSGGLPRVNQWRLGLAEDLGLLHDVRLTRPAEWNPERGLRDNRAILFQPR